MAIEQKIVLMNLETGKYLTDQKVIITSDWKQAIVFSTEEAALNVVLNMQKDFFIKGWKNWTTRRFYEIQ